MTPSFNFEKKSQRTLYSQYLFKISSVQELCSFGDHQTTFFKGRELKNGTTLYSVPQGVILLKVLCLLKQSLSFVLTFTKYWFILEDMVNVSPFSSPFLIIVFMSIFF